MTLEISETKLYNAKKVIKVKLEMLYALRDAREVMKLYNLDHNQVCTAASVLDDEINKLKGEYATYEQEYVAIYRKLGNKTQKEGNR